MSTTNLFELAVRVVADAGGRMRLEDAIRRLNEIRPSKAKDLKRMYSYYFTQNPLLRRVGDTVVIRDVRELGITLDTFVGASGTEGPSPEAERPEPETRATGVEVISVDPDAYMPRGIPKYVALNDEFQVFEAHLESGIPLLLVGPKGIGKTLSLAAFAAKEQIPIIQFDCSENTKRYDLVGRFVLIGEEVKFLLGAMPTAVEVANAKGACILVFEELNCLTPQMQKVLNQLLDWRRHVYVPEVNRIYRLKPGVRLLIAATMNPSTYGGVHELNEDLASRFAMWYWDYPKTSEEERVVREVAGDGVPEEILMAMIKLAQETRASVKAGDIEYALSPRDVIQFCQVYKAYSKRFSRQELLLKALETTVLGRYEDERARDFIKARIDSIFGIVVK